MHTVLLSCVGMLQARRHETIHTSVQVVIQSPSLTCADAVRLPVGTIYLLRGILLLPLVGLAGCKDALDHHIVILAVLTIVFFCRLQPTYQHKNLETRQ